MLYAVPLVFLTAASWTDIKHRKIKNYTTYTMALAGVLAGTLTNGMQGFLHSLGGLFLVWIILAVLPGFKIRAGDIKLAAGCGAWLGFLSSFALKNILGFAFFALLLVLTANLIMLYRKEGFRGIKNRVRMEFYLKGMAKQEYGGIPAAPLMLVAYILAVKYL